MGALYSSNPAKEGLSTQVVSPVFRSLAPHMENRSYWGMECGQPVAQTFLVIHKWPMPSLSCLSYTTHRGTGSQERRGSCSFEVLRELGAL